MNTPNPLIPQGSLLEQKAKGKPHLRVAYIIVAVHLIFLGGLLIQGCKKEDANARTGQPTNDSSLPPLDQSNLYQTNAGTQLTNLPPPELTALPPASSNLALPGPGALSGFESGATRDYIVVQHDSFYTIGKKFGVSVSAIAKANPGVDSTRLKVGQKLIIPAAVSPALTAAAAGNGGENVYTVKSGDTLSRIAAAHGTTVNEIKALNSLKTDHIQAGEKLKLPAPRTAPATAPANPGTPTAPPPGGPANL